MDVDHSIFVAGDKQASSSLPAVALPVAEKMEKKQSGRADKNKAKSDAMSMEAEIVESSPGPSESQGADLGSKRDRAETAANTGSKRSRKTVS